MLSGLADEVMPLACGIEGARLGGGGGGGVGSLGGGVGVGSGGGES